MKGNRLDTLRLIEPPPPSSEPPHDSATGHVTGTAAYVEDLPALAGELWVTYVPSPVAHGRLLGIDTAAARSVPGVVGVYTHADLPGRNLWGAVIEDEPCLPAERLSYRGQPVAVIAGESREAAERARALVRLELEEEAPVLTIAAARERGSFIGVPRTIARGDLAAGWAAARHRLEGTFTCGGQEHFYLESQAVLSWMEEDTVYLHSSTQNPTEIQKVVADALGVPLRRVVCQVRRMGGGFGGKETQAALPAVMAALATFHTGRPARVVYTKDDDMRSTGKRHPYEVHYRVGCDARGVITAAELAFWSDGGAFADLSTGVLERTMLHADNAYYLANVRITGRVCRTNLPPNTAFRGFGAPQAVAAIEKMIEDIAVTTGRDSLDVRLDNGYDPNLDEERAAGRPGERCTTPYGQEVRNHLLPEMMRTLERRSSYRERLIRITRENGASETHLRGIALVPVKFGISFTTKFLNQANALVNVYTDGTVQVSTGATEMGQGVNTKLAQLAASELGIDRAAVAVMPTSTEKNHNTSPTAASASTDLNGAAVVAACSQIRSRLAEFAATLLDTGADQVRFAGGRAFVADDPTRGVSFGELCARARRERIDLGARGFYATPGIDWDRETGRGNPFFYFTTGAAVAEVLVDRLSGELKIERLDVLMDIGRILNYGIERGQVIGGLVQGIGWATTEEVVWSERGELLAHSPTTYKIPIASDLPAAFDLAFVDNQRNRHNLRSTKAVGEPPLMLGLSVWAAINHALSHLAPAEPVPLRLPATHEEILRAITLLERRPVAAVVSPA